MHQMKQTIAGLLLTLALAVGYAQPPPRVMARVEDEIRDAIREKNIPGMSVVIVRDGKTLIRNYGLADRERQLPVTDQTLFELGSCSKAFTALAVLKLAAERRLSLDDAVTRHIPWFRAVYDNEPQPITLRQLLHHTSGIPWHTIARIPEGNTPDMLEKTVRELSGVQLARVPGSAYEYATVGYDILGQVVQQAANRPFEAYVEEEVLRPLGLENTSVGKGRAGLPEAAGYKVGFFRPRRYQAPRFRGNAPAGYVVSNAADMARWLRLQLGQPGPGLGHLIEQAHRKDESVAPHGAASYGYGWEVSLKGDGVVSHGGLNPNYTAYVGFIRAKGIGVAILTNSNNNYAATLGERILYQLAGRTPEADFPPAGSDDKTFSVVAIASGIYGVVAACYLAWIVAGVFAGKRRYQPLTARAGLQMAGVLGLVVPALYGIYLLPEAQAHFTWKAAVVWSPVSLPAMAVLLAGAIVVSYAGWGVARAFPAPGRYREKVPQLVVLSLLAGLSNMLLIMLITSAVTSQAELKYLLFYFGLTFLIYIAGRKVVQTALTGITLDIICELRVSLLGSMFATSYQHFGEIERGRLYATLNDDTNTLGNSATVIIGLATSAITVTVAFAYLATIAFWATLLIVLLIAAITAVYQMANLRAMPLFEEARNTGNKYMTFLNNLLDGYQELSLHQHKKGLYKAAINQVTDQFRSKSLAGQMAFINAFMVGESLLLVTLATVAFLLPLVFPAVQDHTLLSFIIVLLYLIGPVNGILNAIPQVARLRIAWKRIDDLRKELPATDPSAPGGPDPARPAALRCYEARGVRFDYARTGTEEGDFSVGPVSLHLEAGEVLFITGGNGSGKTTLCRMLTGLYAPREGEICIDGEPVDAHRLGEYFSVVYNPHHLFDKLYGINAVEQAGRISHYLERLHLSGKVAIDAEGRYSTTRLSTGQKKRLALLQCYLDDRPIYLFDEWAAEQDPQYRRIFYQQLIPEMKAAGKIVIAITHDDHYFDVADKVLKLDRGKVELFMEKTSSYQAQP